LRRFLEVFKGGLESALTFQSRLKAAIHTPVRGFQKGRTAVQSNRKQTGAATPIQISGESLRAVYALGSNINSESQQYGSIYFSLQPLPLTHGGGRVEIGFRKGEALGFTLPLKTSCSSRNFWDRYAQFRNVLISWFSSSRLRLVGLYQR
jgi:hypothetical protein